MGLFDKVFSKGGSPEAEPITEQEAFIAVALATSGADGHVSNTELNSIGAYINRMRMFQNLTDSQLNASFERLLKMLRSSGPGALVQAAKGVLEGEVRETAFACAVDIALADGVLDEGEKELLAELQLALDVPENIAISIIQVMLIKNRV